jgi:hypothetical protein
MRSPFQEFKTRQIKEMKERALTEERSLNKSERVREITEEDSINLH